MSGVQGGALFDCVGSGRKMGEMLLKEAGVSSVRELETMPYSQLAEAFQRVRCQLRPQKINSGETPCRNGFYAGDPLEVPFRRETAHIPLLIGSTFGEFSGFGLREYDRRTISETEAVKAVEEKLGKALADEVLPLFRKAYPERNPIDLLGMDYMFREYTLNYIKRRAAAGCAPIWDYLFSLDGPMCGGQLPPHGADIPFVFHNTAYVPSTQEAGVTERMEKRIFETVMAFVHTGNPNNPEIPLWEPAASQELHTLVLNCEPEVRTNFDEQLVHKMSEVFLDDMVDGLLRQMSSMVAKAEG